MSRAEIAQWISSARDFDDEDQAPSTSQKVAKTSDADDEQNWDEFVEIAKTAVLSSGTKRRTAFVNEKLLALATRAGVGVSSMEYHRSSDKWVS